MMFFLFLFSRNRRQGNTLDLFLVHLASSTDLLKRRRDSRAKRPGGAFPPQTKHAERIPVCLNHPRAIYRLSPAGGAGGIAHAQLPCHVCQACVYLSASEPPTGGRREERGGSEGRRRRLALMWPSFERGSETGGAKRGRNVLCQQKKKEEKNPSICC